MFEDSKNMRKSVELYFSDSEQVFIAQSFANANNAVKHVRNFKPDIVLMDIDMPGVSGIEALEQIKVAQPEVKVMMMAIFDDAVFCLSKRKLIDAPKASVVLSNSPATVFSLFILI